MARETDDTPKEILVVHGDDGEEAARTLKKNLPVKYPVSVRSARWGWDPRHYLVVIVLGEVGGSKGNTLMYDIDSHRTVVRDLPEVKYMALSRRAREQALGEHLAERVLNDLRGAV